MVGNAIVNFFAAIFYIASAVVVGSVRFVIALLGPGLTAALVVLVATLWYLGWLF